MDWSQLSEQVLNQVFSHRQSLYSPASCQRVHTILARSETRRHGVYGPSEACAPLDAIHASASIERLDVLVTRLAEYSGTSAVARPRGLRI